MTSLVGRARRFVARRWLQLRFRGSQDYWTQRYALGDNSGAGSYGEFATFKAEFLNDFVDANHASSVIEFGCGDGAQLELAHYPRYIGLDVAPGAIERCSERFADDPHKSFFLVSPSHFHDPLRVFRADVALSLDVLFHLVEDEVFDVYLRQLFAAADRFVVVFSSNSEVQDRARHVRHRPFTGWVTANCPDWKLREERANPLRGSEADFFVYEKMSVS